MQFDRVKCDEKEDTEPINFQKPAEESLQKVWIPVGITILSNICSNLSNDGLNYSYTGWLLLYTRYE